MIATVLESRSLYVEVLLFNRRFDTPVPDLPGTLPVPDTAAARREVIRRYGNVWIFYDARTTDQTDRTIRRTRRTDDVGDSSEFYRPASRCGRLSTVWPAHGHCLQGRRDLIRCTTPLIGYRLGTARHSIRPLNQSIDRPFIHRTQYHFRRSTCHVNDALLISLTVRSVKRPTCPLFLPT